MSGKKNKMKEEEGGKEDEDSGNSTECVTVLLNEIIILFSHLNAGNKVLKILSRPTLSVPSIIIFCNALDLV
jgi:hypothetical protein